MCKRFPSVPGQRQALNSAQGTFDSLDGLTMVSHRSQTLRTYNALTKNIDTHQSDSDTVPFLSDLFSPATHVESASEVTLNSDKESIVQ